MFLYLLKILAHSVDFNELYRNVTIHCPSFQFSEIDIIVSVIVRYSFWRVGIIMSKLKNKLCINQLCWLKSKVNNNFTLLVLSTK